jgi:hypothetical protein
MKREPKLPTVYESLDDDQRKGRGAVPALPEVWWVNDSGVAHTVATDAVLIPLEAKHKGEGVFSFRPVGAQGSRPATIRSNAPAILRVWRDLAKAGYQPTTKRNYQATLRRIAA